MANPNVANTLNQAALDPAASVVVSACAGSGKTWLLVSRIVRALLEGVAPGEILAITFTRKAAQEMAARLREWLHLLATADDAVVEQMLREREVPAARIASLMPAARQLYERYLTAQPGITITTFHSWFLQLLRRAPLDADALGDVTLLEQTAALIDEAWERFAASVQFEQQREAPGGQPGEVAQRLDELFTGYGMEGTRRVLMNFLLRRADWWAYVGDAPQPVAYALHAIAATMEDAPDADVAGAWLDNAEFAAALADYAALLDSGVSRGRPSAEKLAQAAREPDRAARFEWVWQAVFTDKGLPRKYSANKTQQAALGVEAQQRFFTLHDTLAQQLAAVRARVQAQLSYRFNRAALTCGQALLEAYQALKRERRVIDYADIEWRTYQLLCNSEHAIYMLCKLDARYRHVLLDEFQDTNPLQWLTLQRWFESAAEVDARPRVFLVGDANQSIYRFRRAEARLFDESMAYLRQHFGAQVLPNDESRRCAQPIIDVVNRVFAAQPPFAGFRPHTAHYRAKPGRVEVLPLIGKDAPTPAANHDALRNPFVMPFTVPEDSRRAREAALLAARIGDIKRDWWIAADERGEHSRPARYGDIMILVARRTHLDIYERALRDAGIPFVTSRQGGLLDTLEVLDMMALLEFLVSPFDNLKLAHALRSPVFGCSDEDLVAVAQAVRAAPHRTWWQALQTITAGESGAALARARRLLAQWLLRADTLPVHDQLDRIYFEADVLHRYDAAVPAAMRGAVAANLNAFMQRALDVDAGRYPSLPRFIAELTDLRGAPAVEAPDQGMVGDASDAVRIHTVHGAKGLEAPIVWLLDAASRENERFTYEALLEWAPGEARPRHFSMYPRKDEQSAQQRRILDEERTVAAREASNLLYVAMTRAKQALIVSGCDGKGRTDSWYEKIAAALGVDADASAAAACVVGDNFDHKKSELNQILTKNVPQPFAVDVRLSQALPTGARRARVDSQGARYGTLFHALIEQLSVTPTLSRAQAQRALGVPDAAFDALWRDAQSVLQHADYRRYFDAGVYARAANEVALVTADGATLRIDRLVELEDEVCVLDYKTGAQEDIAPELLAEYRAQVAAYCVHMTHAFGGRRVSGLIIFSGGGSIAVTV